MMETNRLHEMDREQLERLCRLLMNYMLRMMAIWN